MTSIKQGNYKLYAFFIAFFLVFSLNPFYVWGVFKFFYVISFAFLIFFSFFVKGFFDNRKIPFACIIFLFVFSYYLISGASIPGAISFGLAVAFVICLSDLSWKFTFGFFKSIYALLVLPGLMLWFAHAFVGNDFLYLGRIDDAIVPNQLKVEAGESYILYPFTVVLDYMLYEHLYRFMGPFDEPGVVGTISALVLIANRLKFESIAEYIIFISGVVSFSIAFYAILIIYLIVISFFNLRYLFFALTGVFFLLGLYKFGLLGEQIEARVNHRLLVTNGAFLGDNRSNSSLDFYFSKWINSNFFDVFFGIKDYVPDGSSSWKDVIVKTGFLGFLIIVSVFSLIFFMGFYGFYNSVYVYAFVGAYFSSLYQRPDTLTPTLIFIFISGLLRAKDD